VSTVAFATLGCRLNQVDSQELAASLAERGVRPVGFDERADVVVVNTCTVTGRAEVSDRQMIRRARRQHPEARLVVTGCWAQTDPAAVAALAGVDVVVGNADKPRLPEIVAALVARDESGPAGPPSLAQPPARAARAPGAPAPGLTPHPGARVEVSDIATARTLTAITVPVGTPLGRSRAFLKVQEGCQHRCAFCIVPMARGVSRSLDPKVVVDQARALIERGHRELVLTGVDLGYYGADLLPRTSLAALVRALAELPGLRWLRLSSVLPAYFTTELLEVVTTCAVVAPHLHIPLQSGSDRVLRRMRRPYSVAMYRTLVERLATRIPGLGLGADVIVGFPGETDDDFRCTRALVDALPFSYLHVFGYSDRRGTEGAGLSERVPASTMARRSRDLRALAEMKSLAFRERLVGTEQEALVLEARDRATGALVGLTGNYVEVTFEGADALMRTITPLRILAADASGTRGTPSGP
jgi:threonylcarbamoyladenosine tRNA methylthiotransferase MtaB